MALFLIATARFTTKERGTFQPLTEVAENQAPFASSIPCCPKKPCLLSNTDLVRLNRNVWCCGKRNSAILPMVRRSSSINF